MKAILTYPPFLDGELHIEYKIEENRAHQCAIKIELTFAMEAGETTEHALRRLGKDLVNQPMKVRA